MKISEIESVDSIDLRYFEASASNNQLDNSVIEILNENNKNLIDLKKQYGESKHPATKHSFWSDNAVKSNELKIESFRGDNLFLWQFRSVGSSAHLKYILYTYYIKNMDYLNLLDKLKEDELFGVYVFDVNGKYKVSRDLLDSISEIYFLERQIKISEKSKLNVLDIGAGYGRLAHRFVEALNNNTNGYYCVDAIAESTYICDFYLKYRGVDKKAKSIPLLEIEGFLDKNKIDIAINIHSFSECTLDSIKWWIDLIRKHNIKYLMIVPNPGKENKLISLEQDRSSYDYRQYLENSGYKLKVMEPKFLDLSLQQLIHHHPVYYYLFELN